MWICKLCGGKSFSVEKPTSCSGNGNGLGCDGGEWTIMEDQKWSWKMDWCKKNGVPPANKYWWDAAEKAFNDLN